MNRNCYQLVFNATLGMVVPQAETARRRSKSPGSVTLAGVVLASSLLAAPAFAVLPVASPGGTTPAFVGYGQASYQSNGTKGVISQVGNTSILNWKSFNVGAGNTVQFQQVDSLAGQNLVAGAKFTSLNRIWDANPSSIAGNVTQAAGQQANVILVNNNGIAFMNGAQVNLNSFTATSLNMADKFVTESFFGEATTPQFEGTTGFIKVMEGAQITAGSQGRVLLLAPTVVNRGVVTAADGQVILAAGSKAYLRVADSADLKLRGLLIEVDSPVGVGGANTRVPAAIANATEDLLGSVTNAGTVSTPRGNITMVGYAVNQSGTASATTSVVANGSIYLMAKDTATPVNSTLDSSRAGTVKLSATSVTTIAPDVADATTAVDGTAGAGLDQTSQVRVLGKQIYMEGGAKIIAPSAKVDLIAVDDPSKLIDKTSGLIDGTTKSTTARVYMASGATIDVAGLSDVAVSVARNTVEVELRGDELKDSPVNQAGPLRGQKVFVDIGQALANANAGQATLVAQDSLLAYAAKTTRTVAERSTMGGTVNIRSEGDTIIANGAAINLSGGSLAYQSATVQRTLVGSQGKLVDVSNALAATHYDSIPTQLTINYGKWNRTEVFSSGPSSKYVQGYTEGKDAGALNIVGLGSTFFQADVTGTTIVGRAQRSSGLTPKGASLTVGSAVNGGIADYKISQSVLVKSGASSLADGFSNTSVLSAAQRATLELNADLLGLGRVANFNVYTNKNLTTQAALLAPEKGQITLVGNNVSVQQDIEALGGSVVVSARNTTSALTNNPLLQVSDNVAFRVGGNWTNDKVTPVAGTSSAPVLNGGSVNLSADVNATELSGGFQNRGVLSLGQGVSIDASAGASITGTGKIQKGKAGAISLAAYSLTGLPSKLSAYGFDTGGQLSLSANRVLIGGVASVGALGLASDYFTHGGFGSYAITGLTALDVAAGANVRVQQQNRVLNGQAAAQLSGTPWTSVAATVLRDDAVRSATDLSLTAQQEAAGTGDLKIGAAAVLLADPGANIKLNARLSLDVEGALVAHGGSIGLTLDSSVGYFNSPVNQSALWLGAASTLDVSGVAVLHQDAKGLNQGKVLSGGAVTLNAKTGYVLAKTGSVIDVDGASPVALGVPNESGGIGRVVGSDAGSVQVSAKEGLILQSTMSAKGGGASNRNGDLGITLSSNARLSSQTGYDAQAMELHVANTVADQTAGLTPSALNPLFAPTVVTRARIGVDAIEAAGFDRVSLSSRDGIVLDGNLVVGASGALPMRELKLDAARIETSGGNVSLTADALRLGNYDTKNRVGTAGTTQNAGSLNLQGRLVELAGNLGLKGMSSTVVTASETVQLGAITRAKLIAPTDGTNLYEDTALISTSGDLTLKAGVVTPSSYGQVVLQAAGKKVRFESLGAAPTQPLSVLGNLDVEAQTIEQAGRIWAPLGEVKLNAAGAVTLLPGSVTSVAADAGSVLPLGQVQNALSWVVNVNPSLTPQGQLAIDGLPQKSVTIVGSSVDMRAGSTVNVAGGGNMQGYEFTVGPGGSHDILADANVYAVVPSFKGGFAPSDPQEAFNLRVGTSIYLNGMPGLAAGTYTLLPAHYALLPGSYAVRLDTASKILPGQEYTRADGVRIASGYLTDSRNGAPTDASWKGFEVLTGAQIHARSELTVTQASDFFASGNNRPMDAGQLVIATSGTGASSLQLNGSFVTAAAGAGRGAAVDISANKLAIVSAGASGLDPSATVLQVDTLNAMGANSLLLGGTRTVAGDTTTLQVGTSAITLDNASGNALRAPEVILAATQNVTLKAGSKILADGTGTDGGTLTTAGMGTLVRVASSNTTFVRTGNPGNTQGVLTSEVVNGVGSTLQAAKAIALDATKENGFKGSTTFSKSGQSVAGYLAVGASKVNFGDSGNATGVTYSQAALDALSGLASMSFTSYSTFDLYGNVQVGGLGSNGRPTLANITMQGSGLVGRGNGTNTASINAQTVRLSNPGDLLYSNGGSAGTGQLNIVSDTLVLGAGSKTLSNFSAVTVSSGQVVGEGTGSLNMQVPAVINTARLSGLKGSDQTLTVTGGAIALNALAPAVPLTPITELGAKWTLSGDSVAINTAIDLHAGSLKAVASSGDVSIGATGKVDVSGQTVNFYDQQRSASAGKVELNSAQGNVQLAAGATVNVSAATGGDAGTLVVSASHGTVQLVGSNLLGSNTADASGASGSGARVQVDVNALGSFSDFNSVLGDGFGGQRQLRVRSGDIAVATTDTVRARVVDISADAGKIAVAGSINASSAEQSSIALYASSDVTLASTASLVARSSAAGKAGGTIALGSTSGVVSAAAGSRMDVSAGSGGLGGQVNIRAARTGTGAGTGVKVAALSGSVLGASSVVVEAVKTYTGIDTLTTTGGSGSTLSLATVGADNNSLTGVANAIATGLGKAGDTSFHVRAGVEVQSSGDLDLGTGDDATDWNLAALRTSSVEPGLLTLRAAGNININSNVSDGFSTSTRYLANGFTPSAVVAGNSWSYRFVAGADANAANPMGTLAAAQSTGSLNLAADKLIRTGNGSIQLAAAQDIVLSTMGSVVYTAGRPADALGSGFVAPVAEQVAYFTQNGGDISLKAGRNVTAEASTQLYSEWLFRQGRASSDGAAYAAQGSPAWWVRFDTFMQGVATLGGGNVDVTAGGDVINLSVSAPTQARMNSSNPNAPQLVKTGGGNVTVQSGGSLYGGQYFADSGKISLKAGGAIGGALDAAGSPIDPILYPVIALADATARVSAVGDVNILAILNPTLLPQSFDGGTTGYSQVNLTNLSGYVDSKKRLSLFSTYGANAGAALTSLSGNVTLHDPAQGAPGVSDLATAYPLLTIDPNLLDGYSEMVHFLPPSLSMVALQGDTKVFKDWSSSVLTMVPSASGQLDLLAKGNVVFNGSITMSDRDPALFASAAKPVSVPTLISSPTSSLLHAGNSVHAADTSVAHIYAVNGDVSGIAEAIHPDGAVGIDLSKAVAVRAGQDIVNLDLVIQNNAATDASVVQATRDVVYSAGPKRSELDGIKVSGPGRLEVTAGRNLDMGTSGGIRSMGNLENANLGSQGADLQIGAGVGPSGIDYTGAVQRLLAKLQSGSTDATTLWESRWLVGDDSLSAAQAFGAVSTVAAMGAETQHQKVREMVYTALRTTGRDYNSSASGFGGDYSRGYAVLDLVFPGISNKAADGSFANYKGNVNLFASRIKSESGGNIEFMVPGGNVVVGLANTPAILVGGKLPNGSNAELNDVLGMVVASAGDIKGFARNDIIVNQSRILTVGGGDVLLWSSEGGIDAGKGKKTASAVPPPVIKIDAQGNVTQVLQGAATGSGIGALALAGITPGDVDLIAPKGTVNAGDAGIRAGNLNVAALDFKGADNVSVSGKSVGTPVADTSAVTAAASGASSMGDDASKAIAAASQNASDAARAAQALATALKPTIVRVDVLGFGE